MTDQEIDLALVKQFWRAVSQLRRASEADRAELYSVFEEIEFMSSSPMLKRRCRALLVNADPAQCAPA